MAVPSPRPDDARPVEPNDPAPTDPVFATDAPGLVAPLSRRERAAVLARIDALMEYWGITVADLEAPDSPPAATASALPRPVKYRHPVSGATWDGQGPHPEWLRQALLKEGLRVDELKPREADAPDAGPTGA